MKKETWVIVANSAVAKIFKIEKNRSLTEIKVLEHPESRLHDGDLVSSQLGRTFDRNGPGRHAMEPVTSPKLNEYTFFAKALCTHLQEAHLNGKLDRLYVFAAPFFLGLLREHLTPSVAQLIVEEINKDMTTSTTEEIREHLPYIP